MQHHKITYVLFAIFSQSPDNIGLCLNMAANGQKNNARGDNAETTVPRIM